MENEAWEVSWEVLQTGCVSCGAIRDIGGAKKTAHRPGMNFEPVGAVRRVH